MTRHSIKARSSNGETVAEIGYGQYADVMEAMERLGSRLTLQLINEGVEQMARRAAIAKIRQLDGQDAVIEGEG